MTKCGRGAFLFRTDKQAIQCNRALTIVPSDMEPMPPHRQFEPLHRPPAATHRQPNTASKCQVGRERCPKATNRNAAKSCHRLCHSIIRDWVAIGTTFARLRLKLSSVASPSSPLHPRAEVAEVTLVGIGHEDRAVCRSPRSEGCLSAFRRGRGCYHAD
jgi:hypothetical protein